MLSKACGTGSRQDQSSDKGAGGRGYGIRLAWLFQFLVLATLLGLSLSSSFKNQDNTKVLKTRTLTDTYRPIFIAALFTIAKRWKQFLLTNSNNR